MPILKNLPIFHAPKIYKQASSLPDLLVPSSLILGCQHTVERYNPLTIFHETKIWYWEWAGLTF